MDVFCSVPVINGGEDALEQDTMYEQVPDTFRQKVTSISQQTEAPELPPMHSRSRKPSDDHVALQNRSSSAATLPSGPPPGSPKLRARLLSSPTVKTPPPFPAPAVPAPAVPPPSFPAPNPPAAGNDDDPLYARPEVTSGRTMSNPHLRDIQWKMEDTHKKSATLPVKSTRSIGMPHSTAVLGPLPRVPEDSGSSSRLPLSKQSDKTVDEVEEPGYDTTELISADPNYDRVGSSEFLAQYTSIHICSI